MQSDNRVAVVPPEPPALRSHQRVAAFVALAVLLGAALAWSIRTTFIGPSGSFFGAYGTVLITTELLTAIVLAVRARERGLARDTILACAFVFSTPLIIANVITIPATSGTAFAFQTAPWMWSLWHIGWSSLLAVYAWTDRARTLHARPTLLATGALAFACIAVVLAVQAQLPPLLQSSGAWTPLLATVYALVLVLDAFALVGIYRRPQGMTPLDLWIALSIVAAVGEVWLIASSTIRFSIGSYVGRALSALSGLVVLFAIASGYMSAARKWSAREKVAALEIASAEFGAEFHAFGDAVPQILWTATADGSIDWYNRGWYDYTGQTVEEAAGWGWQSVHHPEDLPEVMRSWAESIARETEFDMQFRLRGKDGNFRWFLTRIHPYRNAAGTVVRWFGSNTDIDAQRRDVDQTRRVAEIMQQVFLPTTLPQTDRVALDAVYWPAESDAVVGGDWYDAVALPDGRLLLSIGDVAGHGLEAAVVAGRLRQSIFTAALEENDPAQILEIADRVLRSQSDTIATALVACFDPRDGSIAYANAGHPSPVVARSSDVTWLSGASDPPLGTGFVSDGGLHVRTHLAMLEAQSILAFYTDGVIEFARDLEEGEARLRAALAAAARPETPLSAEEILRSVLGGRRAPDDVALLLLRWGEDLVPATVARKPLFKQWRFHSSHAQSAHGARLELTAFLREHARPESDLFSTELILGELLANTVEHAPGLVEVHIDWTGDRPVLRLRDSGPGVTAFRPELPRDPLDENGRGLFLVHEFAERFEVTPAPGFGTQFTVVLPLRRTTSDDLERALESSAL